MKAYATPKVLRGWGRFAALSCLFAASFLLTNPALAVGFVDPLDAPALHVDRLAHRPMLAAAKAGNRLVAVGLRGVIIYSDDDGASWHQSAVPVQTDLVSVYFATPKSGWATGQQGVILHTEDGGTTWHKQLDGRSALKAFDQYYRDPTASDGATYAAALKTVDLNFGKGPNLPFLDVWFQTPSMGYAVGSFGTLAMTTDGGRNWQPAFTRIDDPGALNLNAVVGADGRVFIAGERGIVYRLDTDGGKFQALKTGYGGSFFGIAVSGQVVLAFGLQGTVYRSVDGGDSWQSVPVPTGATISAGVYDPAARQFVLVTVDGDVLVGDAAAMQFALHRGARHDRYAGICVISKGKYLIAGLEGVHVRSVAQSDADRALH